MHKPSMLTTVHSAWWQIRVHPPAIQHSRWKMLGHSNVIQCKETRHLHIYSSLHKDAHQGPVSFAFSPQDPFSVIKKHGGFPLMALLQQNEIKRLHKVDVEKCQTCFIQTEGYGSMRGAIWRTKEFTRWEDRKARLSLEVWNKNGNSKPTEQKQIKHLP